VGGTATQSLHIGDLANALGISTKTLRYYERLRLLPTAARAGNGYRVYDERALEQARLVVRLRRVGLSIEEVAALLREPAAARRSHLLGLLDCRLQEIGLQISILQGQHDDLTARYEALLDTPRSRAGACVCAATGQVCACPSVGAESAPERA
jgi:DNA-binding transcriptional MerR regulator